MRWFSHRSRLSPKNTRGYTLVELVVVIAIIAVLFSLVGRATGTFSYSRDEAFVRALRERIEFLHYRSISDQMYYQLELSLRSNSYRIGVLRAESDVNANIQLSSGTRIGELSLQLADFLNPSVGDGETLIPPPSFPSLFQPVSLPMGSRIDAVRTRSRRVTRNDTQTVFLVFNPRGFSEFAVIQLTLASSGPLTVVVNPFTGMTETFRGHKDFRWAYGNRRT